MEARSRSGIKGRRIDILKSNYSVFGRVVNDDEGAIGGAWGT